jgi:AraC family transcriptional regulator
VTLSNSLPRQAIFRREETYDSHFRAVARVIDVLRSDRTRTLSVNEMAKIAYMSHFHFIRVFEAITNMTPWKFHWALKLHLAKNLLLTTKMTIIDISMEVGYNSHGTFTRRFTELVGLSPNRFRRLARSCDTCALFHSMRCWKNAEGAPFRLCGRVQPPEQFEGSILVACFPTALAQRRPVAFAWADQDNCYSMEYPMINSFYMRAFALPAGEGNLPWFMGEPVLRSVETPHLVKPHTASFKDTIVDFTLRSQKPTDPPVLLSIGTLLQEESEVLSLKEQQEITEFQSSTCSGCPLYENRSSDNPSIGV